MTTRRLLSLFIVVIGVGVVGMSSVAATEYPERGDDLPYVLDGRFPDAIEDRNNNKDLGQAVIVAGDVVYVGGPFLGIKPRTGGTRTDRPFLAAFERETGDPIDTFRPDLDAEVFDMALSPDGSRLIVGGAFSSVDGDTDYAGLAALDPATGDLQRDWKASISYSPGVSEKPSIRDLELVGDQLYAAGNYTRMTDANGVTHGRYRAARLQASTGAVLDWRPVIQGGKVNVIRTSPDGRTVYVGGKFTVVNGQSIEEFAALNASDGELKARFLQGARPYSNAEDDIRNRHGIEDLWDTGRHLVFVGDMRITVKDTVDGDHVRAWVLDGDPQAIEAGANHLYIGGHFSRCIKETTSRASCSGANIFDADLMVRLDTATAELDETYQPRMHGPNGVWGIAFDHEDNMWLTGDIRYAGQRSVDGLARYSAPQQGPVAGGELVAAGSTWSYDDSGTDHGTAWRAPSFDDRAWATGAGEFGFGDGDETTAWTAGHLTYYARTSFDFNDNTPASLELQLKADDAVIVYLNGTEVLRDNLPAGTVAFDTPASTWRSGADEDFRSFHLPADALLNGTNSLAVEVHNVWRSNLDLSFEAVVTPSTQPPDGGLVPPPPATALIEAGATWNHADSANGEPANWKQGLPGAAVGGAEGVAELGFGDGDEATTLTSGQATYYFTRTFTVDDPANHQTLDLSLAADDGAVVYLNGTEILRVRMPIGPIGPETSPSAWAAGADERLTSYQVPGSALVKGDNVLAVEVHNFWPGNRDLTFDLELQ